MYTAISNRTLRDELLPHLKFGVLKEGYEGTPLQEHHKGEEVVMGCALTVAGKRRLPPSDERPVADIKFTASDSWKISIGGHEGTLDSTSKGDGTTHAPDGIRM